MVCILLCTYLVHSRLGLRSGSARTPLCHCIWKRNKVIKLNIQIFNETKTIFSKSASAFFNKRWEHRCSRHCSHYIYFLSWRLWGLTKARIRLDINHLDSNNGLMFALWVSTDTCLSLNNEYYIDRSFVKDPPLIPLPDKDVATLCFCHVWPGS